MAEFDYSQYDNGDDYTIVDAIYDMLHQADSTSRPMSILLECYNKYENHTSEADAIANDKEALDWLDDYWEYVCWTERGNQIGMEELGGFNGMAETITNPSFAQQVIDYLQYDDEIDEDTQNLIDRLKQITARYNGVDKMKKMGKMAWEGKSGARRYFEDFGITFDTPYGQIEAKHGDKLLIHPDGFNATDCYFGGINNDGDGGIRGSYTFWLWWNEDECQAKFEGVFHSMIPGYFDKSKIEDTQQNYNFGSIVNSFNNFISDFVTEVKRDMETAKNEPLPYGASTKKSIPSIHDMIAQTRANNNSLVKSRVGMKKEYAELEKYDDVEYMAMACTDEIESVFKALNENYLTNIEFKCSPDEYYQKLLECKKICDWLVDNVSFITRL